MRCSKETKFAISSLAIQIKNCYCMKQTINCQWNYWVRVVSMRITTNKKWKNIFRISNLQVLSNKMTLLSLHQMLLGVNQSFVWNQQVKYIKERNSNESYKMQVWCRLFMMEDELLLQMAKQVIKWHVHYVPTTILTIVAQSEMNTSWLQWNTS